MPYTRTSVSNMAIGHIGVGSTISDVDADNTAEAIQCRRFFDHTRDMLLEMRPWAWAEREITLQNLGDPPTNWCFRYKYPNTIRRVNKIINPTTRTPNLKEEQISFRIRDLHDGFGKVILTDQEDAVILANAWLTDPALYSALFAQTHSLLLATHISGPLRVDAAIAKNASDQFRIWKAENVAVDFDEAQEDPEPESQFVTTRA